MIVETEQMIVEERITIVSAESLLSKDYAAADQVLRDLYPSRVGKAHLSSERYLYIWARTVEDVEGGYNDIVAEYQYDLTYRETLENLIAHAPPLLAAKLLAALAPWDTRFLAATQPVPHAVFGSAGNPRNGFWWFRVPLRLHFTEQAYDYYQADWARHFPTLYPAPQPAAT